MAFAVATGVIGLVAALFVAWPFLRRGRPHGGVLGLSADPREPLLEEKAGLYRALRELDFEHGAGQLSDEDHASLRERYETRAAHVLGELDALALPTRAAAAAPPSSPGPSAPWTRRPGTVAMGAMALLVFGISLGLGIARYTEPDPMASGSPAAGGAVSAPPGAPGDQASESMPSAANAPRGPLTPEMRQGMLGAARASLQAGRYGEAIAAYQAVLKRDHRNVDALTHLGLIVAIGGHADAAIETLDRALAIDPNYPPALLYRGQVLYEAKRDYAGAAKAWEKFMVVVPDGAEHDRVAALAREARVRSRAR